MTDRLQLSRWAASTLFSGLAVITACSSSTDSNSGSGGSPGSGGAAAGGSPSGGSPSGGSPSGGSPSGGSANGGATGSGTGGATNGGSAAGGASSGGASQGGMSGAPAQGGAAGGGNRGGAAGATSGGAGGVVAMGGSSGGGASGAAGASTGGSGGGSSGFTLTSPAWTSQSGCAADNKSACGIFPKENIGASIGGTNKSPELDWTEGPSGTQSYAIVLQDLTNIMNGKPFVHWTIWNITGATRMLPAGLDTAAMPSVPAGSSQKSYSGTGYQGSGKCGNVYEFVLYALTTATYAGSTTSQTAVRDGLEALNVPTTRLRARSGAPGCTE